MKTWVTQPELYVANAILLAMLVLGPLIVIPLVLMRHLQGLWPQVVEWATISVALALIVGYCLRRFSKYRPAVTFGAYAQGFLSYAIVRALYGLILLTTGYAKTGYRSFRPGHRADSAYDLLLAGVIGLLAGICAIADMPARARRREHHRRASAAAGQE